VSAFGGAFLLMVFFKFMLDRDKDEHWISIVERPLARADSTGRCNSLMESFSWCLVI
jgi:hypothetical protein